MSKKVDNAITEILDLEILPPEQFNSDALLPAVRENDTEITQDEKDDYGLSRRTLHNIIEKGNIVLEDMMSLARETESPRMYEVLSTMMKTMADSTKDLSELHKRTRENLAAAKTGKKDAKIDETNISVDKAVFIGTTADLLKMKKETNG